MVAQFELPLFSSLPLGASSNSLAPGVWLESWRIVGGLRMLEELRGASQERWIAVEVGCSLMKGTPPLESNCIL